MEYLSDWRTDLGGKKNQPIYYEFTACPIAEFAKQHDLLEVMPAICNPDYAGTVGANDNLCGRL
ncbi:L-2-amino-thiazoline-4-carboxylic acid hydrolase [Blautia sp.]|uniref:L-2-amino-thiazoline-4-carboxylic acid hydrolase n=1 Tax=Blautia sp. TaxID=1955243 RepID=UPI003FD7A582